MSESQPNEVDVYTLDRFREGDISALSELFKLYGPRVHRLTRRMMGNQADADDATQEIFVRAHEQAAKFDGRSGLFTWLYRLAVRHCLNKIKQRRRGNGFERLSPEVLEASLPASTESPGDRLITTEQAVVLDAMLQSLPPNQRACLLLREVEELSYAQIGELLEVPIGTVMSRLARAREALREKLRPAGKNRHERRNTGDISFVQDDKEQTRDVMR